MKGLCDDKCELKRNSKKKGGELLDLKSVVDGGANGDYMRVEVRGARGEHHRLDLQQPQPMLRSASGQTDPCRAQAPVPDPEGTGR